jgi:hypothetical protein
MQDKAAILISALSEFENKDWAWITIDSVILIGGICVVLFVVMRVLRCLKPVISKDGIKINPDEISAAMQDIQKRLFDEHMRTAERIITDVRSNQHFMDDENKENDEHLKQRCQERTNTMRIRLKNDLYSIIDDKLAVRAVCVSFRAAFGNAIVRNHFTKELMPDRVDDYRERILEEIRQEYIDLHLTDERVPPIDRLEKIIVKFVDDWLRMMKDETATTCEEKINVYKAYQPRFDELPSMTDVVEACIQKNERYIKHLRMGK